VTCALQRSRRRGRYSAVLRTITADGRAGANTLTLPARFLGRRAGLYRVSAAPAGGAGQAVHLRIRRKR